MKYRIKIVTYKNGRKTFTPQQKVGLRWLGIDHDGKRNGWCVNMSTREYAIRAIDLNFAGNNQKQTIEFEYITKH
jgi:hypothetical protein